MSKLSRPIRPHVAYFHMGPWPVFVGFTTSETDFNREVRRLGIEADPPPRFTGSQHGNACTHVWENDGKLLLLLTMQVERSRPREQAAALIAHEATHVVHEMREWLNQGNPLGAEAEAYLVQYVTQECLQLAWDTGRSLRTVPRGVITRER